MELIFQYRPALQWGLVQRHFHTKVSVSQSCCSKTWDEGFKSLGSRTGQYFVQRLGMNGSTSWEGEQVKDFVQRLERRIQRVCEGERVKLFVQGLGMNGSTSWEGERVKDSCSKTWGEGFKEFRKYNGSKMLFKDLG